MINPFENAALFLVQTIFDLYIFAILIRVILQWFGASYFNQITQFIVKITDPALQPLKKLLPRIKSFDLPAVVLLMLLEIVKLVLLILLKTGGFPNLIGTFVIAIAEISNSVINIFFYSILITIILSWINPMLRSPVTEILHTVTEPLLAPARRMIPQLGGFDISPIPVMVVLKLISIIFVSPINQFGWSLV